MTRRALTFLIAVSAAMFAATGVRAQEKLEIFSWWAGDEGPALKALIDRYSAQYPSIQVINSTVTGGSGVNARAVLKTRMLGGDPPDSFQVHAGQELHRHVGGREPHGGPHQPLQVRGLDDEVPARPHLAALRQGRDLERAGEHPPLERHVVRPGQAQGLGRQASQDLGRVPRHLQDALQGKGVESPLALGENWTVNHLWESVALGVLGPDDWSSLWKRAS